MLMFLGGIYIWGINNSAISLKKKMLYFISVSVTLLQYALLSNQIRLMFTFLRDIDTLVTVIHFKEEM